MKTALFLEKYNLLKPGSKSAFRVLKSNENLSRTELAVISRTKLALLVNNAKTQSAFYRHHYRDVGDLNLSSDLDAFARLPVLTRSHLRQSLNEILIDGIDAASCNRVSTGGSTGQPATVYHYKKTPRAAALWRMMTWWGIPPGSDIATIYRESKNSLKMRIQDRLICWPQRRVFLDASNLTDTSVKQWLEDCEVVRPRILHGYVGAVAHVAEHILRTGSTTWKPECVWVTSAPLSPQVRNTIRRAFNAPVFDQYGCCEIFYLACENPFSQGLAVFSDLRHIEVVDDTNNPVPHGVEGRLLVTDLENWEFPLIRYELGDRGCFLAEQPEWKLPFPLLAPVKGRESDTLIFPNGQTVSGEFWTTLFDDFPDAVEKFQVLQKQDSSILIRYVSRSSTSHEIAAVQEKVAKMLGDCVPVSMARVSEIPSDRGKIRYVLRETALRYETPPLGGTVQ